MYGAPTSELTAKITQMNSGDESHIFQGIGKDVPRAQRTPSWEIPI